MARDKTAVMNEAGHAIESKEGRDNGKVQDGSDE